MKPQPESAHPTTSAPIGRTPAALEVCRARLRRLEAEHADLQHEHAQLTRRLAVADAAVARLEARLEIVLHGEGWTRTLADGLLVSHSGGAMLDGHPIPVSRTEGRVLAILARRAPAPVDREQIAAYVWDFYSPEEVRTAAVHHLSVVISRLRQRLERYGLPDAVISTPQGYALRTGTS